MTKINVLRSYTVIIKGSKGIANHLDATRCRKPLIFQTMISVRSNNLSSKYQRFTPSGCKEIRSFEFVAKTQFLSHRFKNIPRQEHFESNLKNLRFKISKH